MDFAVWLSGAGRQSCSECREAYARASRPSPWDRKPPERKDPPCATCRPELIPAAAPVAAILSRVQRQWLMDGRGLPMALRLEAVEAAIRQAGWPENEMLELTDEVMRLGDVMVACFHEMADRDK